MSRGAVAVIIIAALLVFTFAWAIAGQERAKRRDFLRRSDATFGKIPDGGRRTAELSHVRAYADSVSPEGCGDIDDITWNDIDGDRIFQRANRTMSAPGEEMLYAWLRHPAMDRKTLDARAKLKETFLKMPALRKKAELAVLDAGRVRRGSLFAAIAKLEKAEPGKTGAYIANGILTAGAVVLLFIFPVPAVLLMIVSMLAGAVLQLRARNDSGKCLDGLAAVSSLIRCAKHVAAADTDGPEDEDAGLALLRGIQEELRESCRELASFSGGSSFVTSGAGVSGGIGDLIIQYINLFFHIDVIRYNGMLKEAQQHRAAILCLYEKIGFIDAAIAAASFEASLPYSCRMDEIPYREREDTAGGTAAGLSGTSQKAETLSCFGQADDLRLRRAAIHAENIYHPLLDNPVPNSISAKRGILLTGSNASGKSTFLKTVAICALLGQALDTVPAEKWKAPFFRIYSSMALKDNLSGGESYFVVEIRSLLRICRASEKAAEKNETLPVLGFIDEVLRGTNTVERIASSAEILASLDRPETLIFAATHDVELTHMLGEHYTNMHFGETVEGNDVTFDYKLKAGRADTRNAIRLLSVSGYNQDVVEKAGAAAARFEKTGVWEL